MKVVISGSRSIKGALAREELIKALIEFGQKYKVKITEMVSGEAEGVDEVVKPFAKAHGVDYTRMYANWEKYNKAAGPIRNERMMDYVGEEGGFIGIWDGESAGTKNAKNLATIRRLRSVVRIVKSS